MLIHPWDASVDETEWRDWLTGREFGELIAVGTEWPVVVPTHFLLDGDEVLLHLARPNPIWPCIEATGRAVLTVVDSYAYVPSQWRTPPGGGRTDGVPTSYYSAVQLRCRAQVLDEPADKACLLGRQLAHFQPEGRYEVPSVDGAHHRLLAGIRGLRLSVVEVLAKFKYDDHKPAQLRQAVNRHLRERGAGHDLAAAAEQARRMAGPQPAAGT